MRRTALALAALVLALGFAAVGCGGEEEASPTADTVTGTTTETTTTDTTETDTTETDTTETDTTETDTTETETTEPGGEGDAEAGKEVFLGSSGCGTCHTLSDAGTSGTVGPNLDDSQPSVDLVVDRVTNGFGGMPSFSSTLSEEDIQNVAAYVSSAAGS
ncbi:MAG: c-type cytochrome [Gaiellaceae bacterium]